ncbi:MAG TPA: hypothetical protein VGW12_00330 [Pyrinomonadaceae bacterium]|nr:hypothetical protein [Pyrinomonadaceae bacterium]
MDTFNGRDVVGGMRRQAELILAGGRCRRVEETVSAAGSSRLSRETTLLIYLAPLASVAWAGGPPGGRERDLVTAAARGAGLKEGGQAYRELSGWLAADPGADFFDDALHLLSEAAAGLPTEARRAVAHEVVSACATLADRCGGMGGLFGDGRAGPAEAEAVRAVVFALRRAEEHARLGRPGIREGRRAKGGAARASMFSPGPDGDAACLMLLMSAVRVAWAEGRVTRRERRVILREAHERGLRGDGAARRRLESFLAVRPAEECFQLAESSMGATLGALPRCLREAEGHSLLELCERVAGASGGWLRLSGRGPVSPEEWRELAQFGQRLTRHNGASVRLA